VLFEILRRKIVNSDLTRDKLNEDNAEDIYDGLKSLKGSALKVAQMLAWIRILPQVYVEKFSLSHSQFRHYPHL
jgi:predicted unusual protein kinase regulating ubiquinone biosynthesis (AarF/ABC1/UbiB family)